MRLYKEVVAFASFFFFFVGKRLVFSLLKYLNQMDAFHSALGVKGVILATFTADNVNFQ